ncbi:MAG TPA: hypothetical protein VF746_21810 [Longimicrobium sp.]
MTPVPTRPFHARRAAQRRLGVLARPRWPGAESRRIGRKRTTMVTKEEPVPFVVGRLARADSRLVVLEPATPSPIPGPWDLRAVFGL